MSRRVPSIFLFGYRGSGKSAVGQCLAARLERTCHDTDQLVEARDGRTIAQIFADSGEAVFRDLEAAVLSDLCDRSRSGELLVVATGGGVVLRPASVDAMRGCGVVVWLTASAATLRSRITRSGPATSRPPLKGKSAVDEVASVLGERLPHYRKAAHVEVSTEEQDPAAAASRILELLESGHSAGACGFR
jgi:shikimate kinase